MRREIEKLESEIDDYSGGAAGGGVQLDEEVLERSLLSDASSNSDFLTRLVELDNKMVRKRVPFSHVGSSRKLPRLHESEPQQGLSWAHRPPVNMTFNSYKPTGVFIATRLRGLFCTSYLMRRLDEVHSRVDRGACLTIEQLVNVWHWVEVCLGDAAIRLDETGTDSSSCIISRNNNYHRWRGRWTGSSKRWLRRSTARSCASCLERGTATITICRCVPHGQYQRLFTPASLEHSFAMCLTLFVLNSSMHRVDPHHPLMSQSSHRKSSWCGPCRARESSP